MPIGDLILALQQLTSLKIPDRTLFLTDWTITADVLRAISVHASACGLSLRASHVSLVHGTCRGL